MRRFLTFSIICFLSGFVLSGCQSDRGVEAGNDNYQPRPVPKAEVPPSLTTPPQAANPEIRGELTQVDMSHKTVTVRVENGMEQTFKWDDQSTVLGLDWQTSLNKGKPQTVGGTQIRHLKGKEGSEVTVTWRDDGGAKTVMSLNVTQLSTRNNSRTNKKGGAKAY